MSDIKKWMDAYHRAIYDNQISNEDFIRLQRETLQAAVARLRTHKEPEADYLIGFIVASDGDRFAIPPKNALAHLRRAYDNGSAEAGLQLALIHQGGADYIPRALQSRAAARQLLEEMAAKNHPHALYELSNFYLNQMHMAHAEGRYIPEEWFQAAERAARAAADMGYCGGYVQVARLYFDGFGAIVPQDHEQAYVHYQKAIAAADPAKFFERPIHTEAQFSLGLMHFNAEGISRDRGKGLALIAAAADMGNPFAQQWMAENGEALMKEGLNASIAASDFYDDSLIDDELLTMVQPEPEGDPAFALDDTLAATRPGRPTKH